MKQLMKKKTIITLVTIFILCIMPMCFLGCSFKETNHNESSLQGLGMLYKKQLIAHAKINAGTMVGDFEVVVLNASQTKEHITFYTFPNGIDFDSITGGLFVKFDAKTPNGAHLFTAYYNYGLQFNQAQTKNLSVTYAGSSEVCYLEVVESNTTILFEYSIT